MTASFQTYLAGATSFVVKQKVELLEVLVGWETGNKYSVKDQAGNQIFFVGEESSCLSRICCGKIRPFNLIVKDNRGQTVLDFSRGLDCGIFFCGCCMRDEVKVRATGGQLLGSIAEECSIFPSFSIKNASGSVVLKISGPLCTFSCFGQDLVFQVMDSNNNQVGSIKKVWGGLMREMFTDADTFTITFPQDIHPSTKALLLGALFMIDFHYFESSGNQGDSGRGRIFN